MTKTKNNIHNEKAKCCRCLQCQRDRKKQRAIRRNAKRREVRRLGKMENKSPPRRPPAHFVARLPTPSTPRTMPHGAANQLGRVYTNTKNKHVVENLMVYMQKKGVRSIIDTLSNG